MNDYQSRIKVSTAVDYTQKMQYKIEYRVAHGVRQGEISTRYFRTLADTLLFINQYLIK